MAPTRPASADWEERGTRMGIMVGSFGWSWRSCPHLFVNLGLVLFHDIPCALRMSTYSMIPWYFHDFHHDTVGYSMRIPSYSMGIFSTRQLDEFRPGNCRGHPQPIGFAASVLWRTREIPPVGQTSSIWDMFAYTAVLYCIVLWAALYYYTIQYKKRQSKIE